MQQDEFNAAADAVNRPQTINGEDRTVSVDYERRKYPNCPIGMFPAICVKAEVKDANPNGQYYQEGDKRVHLRWQVVAPTYQDDQGQPRHYMVFSRPLPLSFGPRSHMFKLWQQLTGTNVNEFLTRQPVKLPLGNGKFKDVMRLTFEHVLFENMKANIIVEHQEYNGEMRPNLVSYLVSDEQKATNFRQLPGMSKAIPPQTQSFTPQQQQVLGTDPMNAPNTATSTVPLADMYQSKVDPKNLPF